jgi:RimJ/RimL family protein N-acetyltransferase
MSKVNLVDIYALPDMEKAYRALFDLLSERTIDQNISHKKMPTWDEHLAFVRSRPYAAWYLIEDEQGEIAGAVYLSHAREVGLFIFRRFWGKKIGVEAMKKLREAHPGRLLANINPANTNSIRFFTELGFVHIQNTYELV